jgi:hypothetical protein
MSSQFIRNWFLKCTTDDTEAITFLEISIHPEISMKMFNKIQILPFGKCFSIREMDKLILNLNQRLHLANVVAI